MVSLATRLNMTPAQQSAFTKVLIEESGGDSSKVNLSYSYADKTRRNIVEKVASTIKQTWQAPKLASLHWDSKLMMSLQNQQVSEERLTVAVGTKDKIKLLGVPAYKSGTAGNRNSGRKIANLTMELLDSWHCRDSIVNMVFDTTAANTGHVTAACVTIQQHLNRALLWSGCRHHIGEVVLTQVFNDLRIETSKSPESCLFLRFRKRFDALPQNTALYQLDTSQYSAKASKLVKSLKDNASSILQSLETFQREDYKELMELCLLFFGGKERISFKRPGAVHKARWMAKLLYAIKICLLESAILQLPQGTIITNLQLSKLKRFVTFATLVYSPWWFSCNSALNSPFNDLKLYQNLLAFAEVDRQIAASAIKALERHLWYLTAEMIPLSLFSSLVPRPDKIALANKLLVVKPHECIHAPLHRYGTGFGKPTFPKNISLSTTLADLVTKDSWFIFTLLQIDDTFLNNEIESWPSNIAFKSALENTAAINVVNDCAERGVKLSSDVLTAARSEEHYQNILQVVEEDRRCLPNLRKLKYQ